MSNINNNRINTIMTPTQVAAVKTAIQTIHTNMPFLTGLTIAERIGLPKINVTNKAFTEDTINALTNNSAIVPSYLNVTAVQNDYILFTQLDELAGLFRQLVEKTEDTQMLAGSEAFISALASYKLFAAAAASGVTGADAVYDSLKVRFATATGALPTSNPGAPTPEGGPAQV